MSRALLIGAALPVAALVVMAQAAPGLAIDGVSFAAGDIASAETGMDAMNDVPIVTVRFTETGTAKFHALQKGKVGKQITITVDGETISSPTLNEEIQGSVVQISGGVDADQAAEIAKRIAPPQP